MDTGRRTGGAVLLSVALLGGLVLAGCDDNVEVIRDPDIRISRGMTWAWKPMAERREAKRNAGERPVVSRDVLTPERPRSERLETSRDWNTEANRQQLQTAIEHALSNKGLVKVNDPATADFLVDYHVAVRTHTATVQHVYPGGYPGLVCGPYGCWSGWGWGPPEVEYQNIRFHEGTFVFDLALRNPRKLAYRAISQRELNRRTISPYLAEQAVHHLLKQMKVQ